MLKLVIFDCDGTLVDSQHIITGTMAAAFEACDLTPPPAGRTREIIGLSMVEAVSSLAPEADLALVERIVAAYRETFLARSHETEPMFEGAEAAIRSLAARDDTVLGIATGKSQRGVRRLLAHYELEACFVTIQTADDAPSKPHPGMIQRAMDDAGANRASTVMIGDTTFDMLMAGNAGVHGLGVDWGYHPVGSLKDSGARHIMSHFNELGGFLQSLWGAGHGASTVPYTDSVLP
jgi:phosphoglycolate phosphatase